jgi:YidC/Oxa1 family membrane protein insertase
MHNLSENTRLLIASALCVLIIYLWQVFFVDPMIEEQQAAAKIAEQTIAPKTDAPHVNKQVSRADAIKESKRIELSNGKVNASINLVGARLDDLTLKNYKVTTEKDSPEVVLLSPSQTKEVYFAEFGWLADKGTNIDLPDSKTLWSSNKNKDGSYILLWKNDQGVTFKVAVSLNADYMFDVKQDVLNQSGKEITLKPYTLISRVQHSADAQNTLIHEGAIGVFDDKLTEVSFGDLADEGKQDFSGKQTQWIGFSDKYWLTAIIPTEKKGITSNFRMNKQNDQSRYQISLAGMSETIASNSSSEFALKLYAGAKELELLDKYENEYKIKLFDRAVDFGVLYFITKPIFLLLHYFYEMIGNFGVAILILTVFIKLLLFPLAHKGFKGMNKLKDLQPKMTALKEKYKDDSQGFQKALLEMYRKEKVNPMAGCFPILLQIPVFFALYKVLSVTLEMRHAPFFGWIQDLSAPDPLTFVNLFGLIPWDPPTFLSIGIFPLLMAATMYAQQRMNPEPTDPVQAKVMRLMPLLFLFMFASFPSGLVIYWTWSNILSILQQGLIKKMAKV